MKVHKIKYFSKSENICFNDFSNRDSVDIINIDYVVSVSELKAFRMPFSGETKKERSSIVRMINGDSYHIREASFNELTELL